jgi:hypothetical protein
VEKVPRLQDTERDHLLDQTLFQFTYHDAINRRLTTTTEPPQNNSIGVIFRLGFTELDDCSEVFDLGRSVVVISRSAVYTVTKTIVVN